MRGFFFGLLSQRFPRFPIMQNPACSSDFSRAVVVVQGDDFAVILPAPGEYRVRRGDDFGEACGSATEAVLAGIGGAN